MGPGPVQWQLQPRSRTPGHEAQANRGPGARPASEFKFSGRRSAAAAAAAGPAGGPGSRPGGASAFKLLAWASPAPEAQARAASALPGRARAPARPGPLSLSDSPASLAWNLNSDSPT
jgi:hypothetical protein